MFIARLILVPNTHGFVIAARGQALPPLVKGQAPHCGFMSFQRGEANPVILFLPIQLHRVVVASRCQELEANRKKPKISDGRKGGESAGMGR